ncbi:Zn peptidase [Xanthomonas citri subsp. citri Aw12879]|uniref:IrrE N-terminal-like domain-containing protein n=2 Tax=Xanthomonas TaxID=338 RepID=Q8P6K2_XANCP|nr:conserved hypothetical protein [Xanthomonas campestris pv. campestris str. ATCC 33913]AGI06976.1 Zn peptidase [Xanthomonas citri subsp. citri Aw12879]
MGDACRRYFPHGEKEPMKGEQVVGVQPSVMRWARESIGMSIADVAARLKKGEGEVAAWESGAEAPTYPQLERLAYEVYKRPLAVFFLPAPPAEASPRQEFRTLPAEELANLSRDTYLHLRKARAYQLGLEELYAGVNPAAIKAWRAVQLSTGDDVVRKAAAIRLMLGITSEVQAGWGTDDEALRSWRAAVERVGPFVFKESFKQETISGFCLRDSEFPVIYLNNSTTKTRQIFSLLHEFAHVLFDVNGISKFDISYANELPQRERAIEIFCNAIAAEVLIPGAEFDAATTDLAIIADYAPDIYFSRLARRFGVSREVVLRRFLDRGRATRQFYEEKADEWNQQRQKESSGGGSWYANQGSYLSDGMLREVFGRRLRGQISPEKAADYLGVKPGTLPGLEELVLHRKRN